MIPKWHAKGKTKRSNQNFCGLRRSPGGWGGGPTNRRGGAITFYLSIIFRPVLYIVLEFDYSRFTPREMHFIKDLFHI